MPTKQRHEEAVRGIVDKLGIPEELNAKLYEFLHELDLINVKETHVTCLAMCTNGGCCQRPIAKADAVKGLLGVMRIVFDPSVQGEMLEVELRSRFKLLLCINTKGHNSEPQLTGCVKGRMDAVYKLRRVYDVGGVQLHSKGGSCVPAPVPRVKVEQAAAAPVDWKAAYEALESDFRALEVGNEGLEEVVQSLQSENKRLRKCKAGIEDDNQLLREKMREVEEDGEVLSAENSALKVLNKKLIERTESMRDTMRSLREELEGEKSDGTHPAGSGVSGVESGGDESSGYEPDADRSASSASSSGKKPSTHKANIKNRPSIDSSIHSRENAKYRTPPATPNVASTPSVAAWRRNLDTYRRHEDFRTHASTPVRQPDSVSESRESSIPSSTTWPRKLDAEDEVLKRVRARPGRRRYRRVVSDDDDE